MKRKFLLVILALIILLGAALRFYGLEWGVPKDPYWRNHYQDEAFTIGLLFKMGPDNLNPHYFINPSFHYYNLLAVLKTAALVGYIKPFDLPVATNPLGQPAAGIALEDYGRMYLAGRLMVVIESVLLIYLVYLIGVNLYNRRVGLISAGLTAVLPTLVFQSHFLVVDAPAVFWFVLAFWFLTTRAEPQRLLRWSILCGMAIGIAVGTKYTNILLVPPFLFRIHQLTADGRPFARRIFNRYALGAATAAVALFFFTTPYALLSFKEFMGGDASGFGGVFGSRGLLYYNSYPFNPLTPFTVAGYQSLRLPLAVLALLGLANLFWRRRPADILLLFFIVPFYLLLIYHASPHLRHTLMVMPFLMVATGALVGDLLTTGKIPAVKTAALAALAGSFIYTLLFSLALVGRMTRTDSRIESAEWLKTQVAPDATLGLASYFPWNFTPPIENVFNSDKIALTNNNYQNLITSQCRYFIITEYELRDFAYGREDKYTARRFVSDLFSQRDYRIIKVFKRDFEIFGLKFNPRFPNMDWNPVNPEIFVFQKR